MVATGEKRTLQGQQWQRGGWGEEMQRRRKERRERHGSDGRDGRWSAKENTYGDITGGISQGVIVVDAAATTAVGRGDLAVGAGDVVFYRV